MKVKMSKRRQGTNLAARITSAAGALSLFAEHLGGTVNRFASRDIVLIRSSSRRRWC